MKKYTIILIGFCLVVLNAQTGKAQEKVRHHKAHSHGSGNLNFVTSDKELMVELHFPAHDIVGFEHAPKNDSQKTLVQNAIDFFKKTNANISTSEVAKCMANGDGKVETALNLASSNHDDHDHHKGHDHADFHVTYQFSCSNIAKLNFIKVLFFDKFKNIRNIKAQGVTQDGQFSKILTVQSPQFDLSK